MNKILPLILIVAIGGLFYSALSQINKTTSIKTKRVACQEDTKTSEKVFIHNPIIEGINLLESGNYLINATITNKGISQEQINENLMLILKGYSKELKQNSNKLQIEYKINEDTKSSKETAGILVLEFKVDNKPVYKIQSDYLNNDIHSIMNRMNCAVESFTSLK